MKKVIIYVEGISDKLAMESLFKDQISLKQQNGTDIRFFESPKGNRKANILLKVPVKAANILAVNPSDFVVALPDLYPINCGFLHSSIEEIRAGMQDAFLKTLKRKKVKNPAEYQAHFKIFCFKHDMEVLLLASSEKLKQYFSSKILPVKWKTPVEEQNKNHPPKRIIEKTFEYFHKKYGVEDAARILKNGDSNRIAAQCPECFKPLVEFLENV